MREIKFINYDGKYPNLCSGNLIFTVNNQTIECDHVLISGGKATFDTNWNDLVTKGNWSINFFEVPIELSKEEQDYLTFLVNKHVPKGCCGGCL